MWTLEDITGTAQPVGVGNRSVTTYGAHSGILKLLPCPIAYVVHVKCQYPNNAQRPSSERRCAQLTRINPLSGFMRIAQRLQLSVAELLRSIFQLAQLHAEQGELDLRSG